MIMTLGKWSPPLHYRPKEDERGTGQAPHHKRNRTVMSTPWSDWDHLVMLIETRTPPTRGSHSCIARQKAEANRLCERSRRGDKQPRSTVVQLSELGHLNSGRSAVPTTAQTNNRASKRSTPQGSLLSCLAKSGRFGGKTAVSHVN